MRPRSKQNKKEKENTVVPFKEKRLEREMARAVKLMYKYYGSPDGSFKPYVLLDTQAHYLIARTDDVMIKEYHLSTEPEIFVMINVEKDQENASQDSIDAGYIVGFGIGLDPRLVKAMLEKIHEDEKMLYASTCIRALMQTDRLPGITGFLFLDLIQDLPVYIFNEKRDRDEKVQTTDS